MLAIWPAVLVAGVSFAVPQFLVSNYHGPWLVDVVSAVVSMGALTLFLRSWKPRDVWVAPGYSNGPVPVAPEAYYAAAGHPGVDAMGDPERARVHLGTAADEGAARRHLGDSDPGPGAAQSGACACRPSCPSRGRKPAIFVLNWLSATGSGHPGVGDHRRPGDGVPLSSELAAHYWRTLKLVKFSLVTIAAMMAVGYTTRLFGRGRDAGPGIRRRPARCIRSSARCSDGWASR